MTGAVIRRQVAPPYAPKELRLLRINALDQPTAPRRRAARALLALGLGARLDGRWATRVASQDVATSSSGVRVRVGDPSARSVVALAGWEDELTELAATAGDEFARYHLVLSLLVAPTLSHCPVQVPVDWSR